MHHVKSESDVTSLAPSSPPRTPKPDVYYVHSPSRDSHDGDKFSSVQPSPMGSPSHHSSTSRFSGVLPSSDLKRNDKGWPECDAIKEEGNYDEFYDDKTLTRLCQAVMGVGAFVLLFTIFCLILWGAGRPFKAEVAVKSLSVSNFYIGSGSDSTGVPTNMLNFNGSLKLSIYNPATFYGIYVSSRPVNLVYSDAVVATGELKKHFQPRKSRRTVLVHMEGTKVPLYGAGLNVTVGSNNAVQVPLTLNFTVQSIGDVVGKLVRTKQLKTISCPLKMDSASNKIIQFKKKSCDYSPTP